MSVTPLTCSRGHAEDKTCTALTLGPAAPPVCPGWPGIHDRRIVTGKNGLNAGIGNDNQAPVRREFNLVECVRLPRASQPERVHAHVPPSPVPTAAHPTKRRTKLNANAASVAQVPWQTLETCQVRSW